MQKAIFRPEDTCKIKVHNYGAPRFRVMGRHSSIQGSSPDFGIIQSLLQFAKTSNLIVTFRFQMDYS